MKVTFYSTLVEDKTYSLNAVNDDNYHPQIEELLLDYIPEGIVIDEVNATSFTTVCGKEITFDLHE